MSASSVQAILSRAISEAAFTELLLRDPERALSGYELSADEIVTLKSMSRADFDQWTSVLPEQRRSFGGWNRNESIVGSR